MDRQELIQHLIHKRMEARATLEAFKILNPKKHERDLNKLLDRLNEIEKLLDDLTHRK